MNSLLYVLLISLNVLRIHTLIQHAVQLPTTCDSPIYCKGNLLHVVQFSYLYKDCKTFVDLKLKYDVKTTLSDFEEFMRECHDDPTLEQVKEFVEQHFEQDNELEDAVLVDYNPNPSFIDTINDPAIKIFALDLISIWPQLARRVKPEVELAQEQYSLIPVPNSFIVPGGRFREIYYWDSYWIIDGLLVCEMYKTAKGMLENFVSMIKRFGHIPNGTRVYYTRRSQPPLFVSIVYNYYLHTKDIGWIYENIEYLDIELMFWLKVKSVKIKVGGEEYCLAHYCAESLGPRPESYREDFTTASYFDDPDRRQEVYCDLKSGAESGWDFSTRWLFDEYGGNSANLSFVQTRRVAPADLNSILFKSFTSLAELYFIIGNPKRGVYWRSRANYWRKSIDNLLYDKEDGIWYDFDLKLHRHRKGFYTSNFTPLWARAFELVNALEVGKNAVKYLHACKIPDFVGGIPTSLNHSGQQWDFPNAWAPLQGFVIFGLENTGSLSASKEARKFAEKWVRANMRGYRKHEAMFEKYDARVAGGYGGGGEYQVQSGFGWTNGLLLRLIKNYFTTPTKNL